MDIKKYNFIIDHFGCYTPIGDEEVLTSLGTMSFVPAEELWQVFTGDVSDYFQIEKTENDNELVLILNDAIRKKIEREIEYERISKLEVGFGWKWINNSVRCYLEDAKHNQKVIPFLFVLDDDAVQGGYIGDRLDMRIFDEADLIPVNTGANKLEYEPHFGGYFFEGGKYGSINKTGKVQIPLIYDKCIRFTNPYYAIAVKDGVNLLINRWGESIAHNFDELICFYGEYCLVKQNEKYGIADYSMNVIVPVEYDKITCRCYSRNMPIFGTVTLYIGSHCGLFDLNTKKFLVDIAYDKIVEHRENSKFFSVCINDKWGLINQDGDVIVPVEYRYIVSSRDQYLVNQNGKYGVVDKNMSSDHCSWEWKNTSFSNPIPCIYDEVYDIKGEINHTQSLFMYKRFYFAIYNKNGVQIDCYYKWYRFAKNGIQFFTYERLDTLFCEEREIQQTIIFFEKKCEKTE